MRRVDVHAHYISPRLKDALRSDHARLGISLRDDGEGFGVVFPDDRSPRRLPLDLTDLAGHRAHAGRHGLWGLLLSPVLDLAGYTLPPGAGARWSRLVNECAAADIASEDRLAALATLPMQDGESAARELVYAVRELRLAGAMVETSILGHDLGDAAFDPFWRAARELDVPVFLHPFTAPPVARLDRYYLRAIVAYPFETTLAAAGLIFGGVLRRYAGLKIILAHGGGFLPYQIGRFDRAFAVRPETRGSDATLPSEGLRSFYYDTLTHSPAALRYLVETVGADRVLLGSDHPYDRTGLGDPDPLLLVEETGFDRQALGQIVGGNAVRLFGNALGPFTLSL